MSDTTQSDSDQHIIDVVRNYLGGAAFSDRKVTDTPTDRLQVANKGYVDDNTTAFPISVAEGGTGATTLTGVLVGNGTSPVTVKNPLDVPNGGTGNGSFLNAYGIVAVGSTTTAPLQSIPVGSITQVLASNGATGLPTFQDLSSLPNTGVYAASLQTHTSTTSQNVDDVFTCNFQPTVIVLYYSIDGYIAAGHRTSSGIVYFTGTTVTAGYVFFAANADGALLQAVAGGGNTAITFGNTPSAGDNAANDIKITLSVQATSATTFTVRNAFLAGAGNLNTATSQFFPVAYK